MGWAVTCRKAGPYLPPGVHPCSHHALPTGVPGLREPGGAGALPEAAPSRPRGPAGGGLWPARSTSYALFPAAARGHAQPGALPAGRFPEPEAAALFRQMAAALAALPPARAGPLRPQAWRLPHRPGEGECGCRGGLSLALTVRSRFD